MIENHVHQNYSCPECQRFAMTEQEFTDHIAHGPCDATSPFEDFFPEYYVCGDSVDEEDYTTVYLRVDSETGPYYMAWESRDYVERTHGHELLRHDWKVTKPDDTPFPKFEDD